MNTPIENEIVSLTREQLQDPNARSILVNDLVGAGLYDRGTAEFLVEVLRKEANGEEVAAGLTKHLEEHRRLMTKVEKLRSERDAIIARQAKIDAIDLEIANLSERMEIEKKLLADLKDSIGDEKTALQYTEIQRVKGFDYRNAIEYGKSLAGFNEIIGLLERAVIPQMEAQITAKQTEKAKVLEETTS